MFAQGFRSIEKLALFLTSIASITAWADRQKSKPTSNSPLTVEHRQEDPSSWAGFHRALQLAGLKEGDRFFVGVGWRDPNLRARAEAKIVGGKIELTLNINLWGVGAYSRVRAVDIKQSYSKFPTLPYPVHDFQSRSDFKSFSEHPKIAALLTKWEAIINEVYAGDPRLSLKIRFLTPDEEKALGSEVLSSRRLNEYWTKMTDTVREKQAKLLQTKRQSGIPMAVFLNALPSPYVATTTDWDPYSNPLLWAHEICHWFGIHTEGYELFDYPITGIMNGEAEFNTVREAGLQTKAHPMEMNSIIFAILAQQRDLSERQEKQLKLLIGAQADDFESKVTDDADVISMDFRARKERAEKRFESQRALLFDSCDKPLRSR